jgi:hypothetical protein
LAQKSLQSMLSRQSSWHVQARDSTRMIFDGLKFVVCALAALMPASNEQARIATIATTLERLVMTAASFFDPVWIQESTWALALCGRAGPRAGCSNRTVLRKIVKLEVAR